MICPKCGAAQKGEPNFCEKCGFRLKPPEQELKPAAGQDTNLVKPKPSNTTNNMTETPETKKQKKRHGCLTAYLVLILLVFVSVIVYYTADANILKTTLRLPGWTIPAELVLSTLEIICVIALLMWKKWGFWGYCGLAAAVLIVNIISGANIYLSVTGLTGIAITYGMLNIGDKSDKGWPQLE